MLNKILIFLLIAGCASKETKKTPETSSTKKSSSSDRVQKHLVDEEKLACIGCIKGSIGDEELLKSDKKIYYLYGAEDYKLKNFYYTGQLTIPGPGVPPSIISGEVVSKYIMNNHN